MNPAKLPNAFVDSVVIVGADTSTGLRAIRQQGCSTDGVTLNNVFSTHYDPFVLASVTHDLARYRDAHLCKDFSYPPASAKLPEVLKRQKSVDYEGARYLRSRSSVLAKRFSRRISVAPQDEQLENSLAPLCFPDDLTVHRERPEATSHCLVLTDISGQRTYASCVVFYRTFCVTEPQASSEGGECDLELHEQETEDSQCGRRSVVVHVPTCCSLISSHPYISALKDAASGLAARLMENPTDFKEVLKEGTIQLTCTPVPPPGPVDLAFNFVDTPLLLVAPENPRSSLCDLDLTLLFTALTFDDVMRIISCVLTEQSTVFVSSSHALLTVAMESVLRLVEPFKWRHVYVPVLPSRKVEILEAPGVFMLGCHSAYKDCVMRVEGIVTVDLDLGEVTPSDDVTLPEMPEVQRALFLQVFRNASRHYQLETLKRPTPLTLLDSRRRQRQFWRHFNHTILTGALEFMVNMFRDALPHVKKDQWVFDKQRFLQAQDETERPFYTKVVGTDMFKEFVKARCMGVQDVFAELEERTRAPRGPRDASASYSADDMLLPARRRQRASSTYAFTVHQAPEHSVIALPPFHGDGHFYSRCIELAQSHLEHFQANSAVKASLHYLLAMLHVACRSNSDALKAFSQLNASDNRLLPKPLVLQLMKGLDKEALAAAHSLGLLSPAEWASLAMTPSGVPRIEEEEGEEEKRLVMDVQKIPTHPVDQKEFEEKIRLLDIAVDRDTIARLFSALTVEDSEEVEEATFENFYSAWTALQQACEDYLRAIPLGVLEGGEMVLKASSLVRTSRGTGRLLLTQKRLLLHEEGAQKHVELLKLKDVTSLEKFEMYSFLSAMDALKITTEGSSEPLTACLREERNWWLLLVREMWSGKIISQDSMDHAVLQQAGLNVLLMDAVIRSGEEESSQHHSNVDFAAIQLSYFWSRRRDGMTSVPENVKETLQHRINPNVGEREKGTLEALLYTPGNVSDGGPSKSPRLWVGLGSGKVKVFDASTWIVEPGELVLNSRVVCMLAVGSNHVWAGCFDNRIYVIGIDDRKSNIVLAGHRDIVTSMALNEDSSEVFSASLDGSIFRWDAATHRRLDSIPAPSGLSLRHLTKIQCCHGLIWCCLKDKVVTLTHEGHVVSSVAYFREGRACSVDTFLVTNDQLWLCCSSRPGVVSVWRIPSNVTGQTDKTTDKSLSTSGTVENGEKEDAEDLEDAAEDRSAGVETRTPETESTEKRDGRGEGLEGGVKIEKINEFEIPCRGIYELLVVNNKVWAGSKNGKLYIFNCAGPTLERRLDAHSDSIRSLCAADQRYVITGSGTRDGKAAIWRT